MAPTFTHPAGVNFVDEHAQKPVNVDAAAYYGGGEAYARSRTYSQVMHLYQTYIAGRRTNSPYLVPPPWIQPQKVTRLSRRLALTSSPHVPR